MIDAARAGISTITRSLALKHTAFSAQHLMFDVDLASTLD